MHYERPYESTECIIDELGVATLPVGGVEASNKFSQAGNIAA
jgi:hypothetical protein